MGINEAGVVSEGQAYLYDELQNLLEKQIEMIRRGDIGNFEALSKQTNSLVERCVQSGIFKGADFENQREKLKKLYEQLSLAISAQKAETSEKLSNIRKGKRTLHAYREGI